MPPFRADGKFKLFKFKNDKTGIYSLSIKCNEENERFFERLCEVVAKESCGLVPKVNGRKLKLEEFELVKTVKLEETFMQRFIQRNLEKANVRYSLNLLKIQFQ